jgi:hypothetical protein
MIKFFYLCDYSDLTKDNPDAMLLHVRVYCLAHKYEIDALKSIAVKLFQCAASTDFSIEKFPAVIREFTRIPTKATRPFAKQQPKQLSRTESSC